MGGGEPRPRKDSGRLWPPHIQELLPSELHLLPPARGKVPGPSGVEIDQRVRRFLANPTPGGLRLLEQFCQEKGVSVEGSLNGTANRYPSKGYPNINLGESVGSVLGVLMQKTEEKLLRIAFCSSEKLREDGVLEKLRVWIASGKGGREIQPLLTYFGNLTRSLAALGYGRPYDEQPLHIDRSILEKLVTAVQKALMGLSQDLKPPQMTRIKQNADEILQEIKSPKAIVNIEKIERLLNMQRLIQDQKSAAR